jgi:hypothetical protein
VTAERQNELTRRIQQRLALASNVGTGSQQDAVPVSRMARTPSITPLVQ